jgi:hypothetical protein
MSRPQFSIRLLLVLVTALCIALGVWGMRAERQRRAVKAIEAAGGAVEYDSPGSETFLRQWLPEDYFDDVEVVVLSRTQPTDDVWAHLERLPTVRQLFLDDPGITDDELVHLRGLTLLQYLDLSTTYVTDAGVARLQGLTRLQVLLLNKTQVTDAGLVHLQGLTALDELWLTNTQVTREGANRLQKALPQCRISYSQPLNFLPGIMGY